MTDENTDQPTSGAEALEHFDLTNTLDLFAYTPDELHTVARELESINEHDGGEVGLSDDVLAEYVIALKAIEDAVEDARKSFFESVLDERVTVGEQVGDLRKVSGSNSYVTDDSAAFDAVLDAGHDPREVASVSASKLKDVLGKEADEFVGVTEYTYFRR